MRSMRILIAAVVVSALYPSAALAQQHPPMPSFAVVASGGAAIRSDGLSGSSRWLLAYVGAETVSGDRLLRAMDSWGIDTARVVILVSGDVSSIEGRIRPLMATAGASVAVYADPNGSAARALKLGSGPALVGVDNGTIAWTVQGVLNDPAMVESVVRHWLLPQ
jgi:hypothetical protein